MIITPVIFSGWFTNKKSSANKNNDCEMSEHKKIFDLVYDRVGKDDGPGLGKLEILIEDLLGMVKYAKKAKMSIEKGHELADNHVNIEDVQMILDDHKEEKIELDVDEETNVKKPIHHKEIKQIEKSEPNAEGKISEKEEIKEKPAEKVVEPREIPLKLNIIEDPLEILTQFKKPINFNPFITSGIAPRKNFFFVANLDDINFYLYGKCKNCESMIKCHECKIQPQKDGVRAVFSMYFLNENPIQVVAFNKNLTKFFNIDRMMLIEITKYEKEALRMKFLDLYRNRLLTFQSKFPDLKKTEQCISNLIFCWKEKNISKYFQRSDNP